MNSFRLIDTVVVKSEMDFTGIKEDSVFKGIVNLSTMTRTPKDAKQNKYAYCSVSLSFGEENDNLKIRMETLSKFEIVNVTDPCTLRKDSERYCSRQALKEALKKLEILTEAHLGKPMHIPLPPDME